MNIKKELQGFEYWLKQKKKKDTSSLLGSTIEKYLKTVEKFLKKVGEIEDKDLIEEANKIIGERGFRASYVPNAVRNYLRYRGFSEEQVKKVKNIEFSTALRSRRVLQSKVLSKEEIKELIEKCPEELMLKAPELGINLSCIVDKETINLTVLVLYDTAIRSAELLGIRVKDIDFERNEIRIRAKGGIIRHIPVSPSLMHRMKRYIEERGLKENDFLIKFYYRLKSGKEKEYKGQSSRQTVLWSILRLLGHRILNREVYPHCLRHSRLSHLANEGADILDIRALAGHRHSTTCDIYIQLSEERLRRLRERMRDVLEEL